MVIAHHIILTGYGHWLPNDPRGSMSRRIRNEAIRSLGDGHYGRRRKQPRSAELRAFYQGAKERLAHPVIWFEAPERNGIGEAFGEVIAEENLTCYVCAVLRNHAHLVIRKHRLKAEEMIARLRQASRRELSSRQLIPTDHPLWSSDPYVAYKDSTEAVRAAIAYVHDNFAKHGIAPQKWTFVAHYNDWPFHKRRGS